MSHKLVYFCMIPSDMVNTSSNPARYSQWVARWEKCKGQVTTDPQPWTVDDPVTLINERKMWTSLSALINSRPELETLVEVYANPEGLEVHVAPTSASQEDVTVNIASPTVSRVHQALPWKGEAPTKPLFNTLIRYHYRLPTAILAVAPRFGGELPALARIMIVHMHLLGITALRPQHFPCFLALR